MHSSALYRGDVKIEGDLEQAQALKEIVGGFDPDWEEPLSSILGDSLVHQLSGMVSDFSAWFERTSEGFRDNSSEWLQEESELLASNSEVSEFCSEVDTLRADTDRLEARLDRIESNPGLGRMFKIERVFVKYAIFELFLSITPANSLRHVFLLSPTRWMSEDTRALPRGQRIRLALEELGPVFVKLGQILSTRRDLLPPDIGDELALLQDRVAPFPAAQARTRIETELNGKIEEIFKSFEEVPIASASVAQVHGAVLHDGQSVVIKVLRPGISEVIDRDIGLMQGIAELAAILLPDGKRLRPREVVEEYDRTIRGELDLMSEATNAVVLRNNFKDSKTLYIPEIHWDYTRTGVMVQERIDGISIRDIDEMNRIGMDMKKLAEHGVEIFYTQVFQHNFFHADMHPGNIFVSRESPEHPQYIAVDFGIIGSLTDEDQRYIGENLLAFFQRDYRRVAQTLRDGGAAAIGLAAKDFTEY